MAGVQREAALGYLARRFSVEQVGGADGVDRERIAGVALAVRPDVLIAEACVGAGAGQQVGIDAGAQDRKLRETAGAERRVLNRGGVEHVANAHVGLVSQGRARDFNGRGHGANF